MKRILVLVFAVCLSTTSFAATQKVLMVALAGYNSCDGSTVPPLHIGMYPEFDRVKKEASTKSRGGVDIQTLVACLDSDAPPDGEAQYILPSAPNKVKYGTTHDIQKAIEAIAKAEPTIAVFIAGHSYGGWMSMFLTQELDPKIDIQGLFTIDPIGPDCGPAEAFFGSDVCHSAPEDLDNKAIKKRLKSWINFYQTEDSWLTSSAIPEATDNHHIETTWGPHSDIDEDVRVWDRIQESIETDLAL